MDISQIDGDDGEATGLQHEVERLDRAIDDALGRAVASGRRLAANPQQPIEIDAGRRRAGDVEAIARVNQRGDLATTRGGAEQVKQERGAPRRVRSGKLRDLTARQSAPSGSRAAQERVDWCDVERDKRGGSDRSSGGNAVVSVRSSFRARSAVSRTASAIFAIFSPHGL